METVLRKVSVKDRLPKITGWYITDIDKIFYTTEFNNFFRNSLNLNILNPEYWYEEVSLLELLPQQAISHLALYDEAKERYEKALKIVDSLINPNNGFYLDNVTKIELIEEALKIAAGLEEL